MANRKQRAARRLEDQEQEQAKEQVDTSEGKEQHPSASPPAGKPASARKYFLILWGIPLVIFIVIAIIKG